MEQTQTFVQYAYDYGVDTIQRSILFMDILRKRGNNYITHFEAGMPPVLTFDYEIVLDGRTFERPVNYALAAIVDRRQTPETCLDEDEERRLSRHSGANRKRPILIFDPRAGHGPGIGGSKRDSEIGIALNNGHPVYFALFFQVPEPGQTIADIEAAHVRFVEEIVRRHPHADKPALIGNCQGGWAAALVCADRPDLTGLLVLNGAPLSYWSGVAGVHPMRYRGGLLGGVWYSAFLSDLGNGKFDGANLVSNFEDLNPANTLWTKQYNLYSQLDTEEERYLAFEKWWGGFYLLTAQEIHFILDKLFIGNKFEQGDLDLGSGRHVSLRNIHHPIVVFASHGDNITPPQQALDWIPLVYQSDDEIVEHGHVIIYILHEDIGHLGIFVSGSVAKKEHSKIIGNFDLIEYLAPGLYEMQINEKAGPLGQTDFHPQFRRRTIAEMIEQLGGIERDRRGEDWGDFRRVSDLSEINDKLYQAYVQPWVHLFVDEFTGEMSRRLHPLRSQRYVLSDLNLALLPLNFISPWIRQNRKPTGPDNPFVQAERIVSEGIRQLLDIYRDTRDRFDEINFRGIFSSLCMECILPKDIDKLARRAAANREAQAARQPVRREDYEKGGFVEAAHRLMNLVCSADGEYDRMEFAEAERIVLSSETLRRIAPGLLKEIIRQQARLVWTNRSLALKTIPLLVSDPNQRRELYEMGIKIAQANGRFDSREQSLLKRLKKILLLED